MTTRIQALILALALFCAGAPVLAQDDAAAAAAPAATESAAATQPVAEAAAEKEKDKGRALVNIEIGTDDEEVEEDASKLGQVLGTGLAAILENHVLTREDLSDADREEVREAIAELRGEIQTETRAVAQEVVSEVRTEVQNEIRAAGKSKGKPRVVVEADSDGDDVPGWVGLVAFVAVILTLGLPIIVVGLILYFGYRKRRLAHETINKFLASGKEIPPEIMHNLFQEAGTSVQAPRTSMHKGTINTGIGLGMIVAFSSIGVEFLAAIGFIFLLVGLAQLLIWKLEQGKKREDELPQG